MSSTVTLSKSKTSEIYHDIYDLSIFPVSLGDIITWGVKSALRADAAGRKKVHVHLVCDPEKAGFNPLQSATYLADLFAVEVLPAFYSHPYFSGLSLHRSREDFLDTFTHLAKDDEVSREVFLTNEGWFKDRTNFDRICKHFNVYCSYHDDINERFKRTGTYPKVGYLKDCLVDWQALQMQFSKETYWVTLQFRLRRLDSGMPVSIDGLHRDAPFLTWYNFLVEAEKRFPFVRFVLLGRLQEKPLEVLRLPNVVALRTLGMNLGHELTALLNSNLYMGSPSGFAQAAHFSDVPYDIFNCTHEGCRHYGIPYGTPHLINATPTQRLHYETETTESLLASLERALRETPKKREVAGALEINRTRSTDRFFINDGQSDAELSNILSSRLLAIALIIERGDYLEAQGELRELRESFPRFVSLWTDLNWLNGVLEELLPENGNGDPIRQDRRNELLADISRYCHPERLIRKSGRFFDNLLISEGFRRDGWCEKKTKLVFAPSKKGDFLILNIARLASGEPTRFFVRINQQEPMPFVLVNDSSVLEIPVLDWCIPTEVHMEADRSFRGNSRDDREFSYQIEAAGLVSTRTPMPAIFRGDKKDLREKIACGIYSNGATSNLVRIRIDNPFPEETEIMVHLIGMMPRFMRRRRHFRIRIDQDEAHEAIISGKHFTASIPCPKRLRHVSVVLQFWDRDGTETEPKDNRAVIKSIEILPATVKKAVVISGVQSAFRHLLKDLKTKMNKKFSKRS
jgi:hypothetical protein